jgi:hypothetical protein
VPIASSAGELTPLSIDSGRILVDEGGGTLAVLDREGATVATIAAPAYSEAKLQGADLVVHVGEVVEDFDAASGTLRHAWPANADARLDDVQAGVAVLVADGRVELLRLTDGRMRTISVPGTGPVHAQLEAPGLFYSFSVASGVYRGRVLFVPFAELFPSSR